MIVWVTRDNNKNGLCPVFTRKPRLEDEGMLWDTGKTGSILMDINAQRFKNLFGFTPRRGSCKQMNLTLEEIK